MNPTLTQWLENYQTAAAQWADDQEREAFRPDADMRVRAGRPTPMHFTITSTGLLRDHAGVKMGHVSEMSPQDLRIIGVDADRLTARQRRTPTPRRNPGTTRRRVTVVDEVAAENGVTLPGALETALTTDTELAALLNAADPWNPPAPAEAAIFGTPAEYDEDAIPEGAAPGSVVTRAGVRVGIVGRNGRNEVVVVRDPNPMHDRLRRHTVPIPQEFGPLPVPGQFQPAGHGPIPAIDLSQLSMPTVPDLSTISEGFRSAAAAMAAAVTPAEFHEGPRMLATLSPETGSGERFTEHTATVEAAITRAGTVYHQRPSLYAPMVRRSAQDAPNGVTVDRNAAAVSGLLARAYGLELNEETLTAVTAMTTFLIRQGTLPAIRRADQAETTAAAERTAHESTRARLREARETRDRLQAAAAAPVTSTIDPGPVEAAVAAAKAWKETGIEDSVAKLASFKHLLDTLEQLAR